MDKFNAQAQAPIRNINDYNKEEAEKKKKLEE